MKYVVEKSDLVGEIKNFELELVQEMVDEQIRQGNNADVTVFQKRKYASKDEFGFDWLSSERGARFWNDVIFPSSSFDCEQGESEKESILQEAERIVNGDRQADYNDPIENFKRIATIASVLIGNEISPKDCCKVMMAVKLAREANKHKRDNLVDLCGYNHILNLIEES